MECSQADTHEDMISVHAALSQLSPLTIPPLRRLHTNTWQAQPQPSGTTTTRQSGSPAQMCIHNPVPEAPQPTAQLVQAKGKPLAASSTAHRAEGCGPREHLVREHPHAPHVHLGRVPRGRRLLVVPRPLLLGALQHLGRDVVDRAEPRVGNLRVVWEYRTTQSFGAPRSVLK